MVFPQIDNNGVAHQGAQGQGQQHVQQQGQAQNGQHIQQQGQAQNGQGQPQNGQGQAQAQGQGQRLPAGPMQAQSFQDYMQQERDIRQEAENRTIASRNEDKERQKAEAQIKRVPPCTGATPQSVRDWIREIDLTIHYSTQTVYIASQTARDALRRELEFFLNSQPNRNNVPWQTLKDHLQQSFLSPHEADRLRHEVEKVKQGGFDTSAAYGRRFREAADLAYPEPQGGRNDDQNRLLLRHYMKGLRDRHIVERLVREGRPNTFIQAMILVQSYEADDYRLHLALDETTDGRQEEAMEVNAFNRKSTAPNSTSLSTAPPNTPSNMEMTKDITEVKRQMAGLTQQFTKLMATLQTQNAGPKGPRAQQKKAATVKPNPSTIQGQPRSLCEYCEKWGHVALDCRKRLRDQGINTSQLQGN